VKTLAANTAATKSAATPIRIWTFGKVK
jgi:hypothetical protein